MSSPHPGVPSPAASPLHFAYSQGSGWREKMLLCGGGQERKCGLAREGQGRREWCLQYVPSRVGSHPNLMVVMVI